VPIPSDIPDNQAASFFVNPATVLAMVDHVLHVPPGAWLFQTAAASALGKMVIRLGKVRGYRTVNAVRHLEQAEELRRLGADEVVVMPRENIADRVSTITEGKGVPFALDAVGGAMGEGAVQALGRRGRLLVYGTLSGEPIPLDPRLLIAGQKSVEGFWLSEWASAQRVWTMLRLFRSIFRLMRAGILVTPVMAEYGLSDIRTAVREAEKTGRSGKVLLRMDR
jgi:NADPH:quinone reductase